MSSRPRSAKEKPERSAAAPGPTIVAADGTSSAGGVTVPWLWIRGARQNNLKNIDVALPLARFVCITGVSGSGKSSLINDILHEALAAELNKAVTTPGLFDRIEVDAPIGESRPPAPAAAVRKTSGAATAVAARKPERAAPPRIAPSVVAHLDKIIAIDQSPIGRTPRSNPSTYIKLFDEIRDLFSKLPDANLRGYQPGRFSFNVAAGRRGGGRCEACEGNGANRVEMDFLADVWVTCPVCNGQRFSRETLQIRYKGKSIADVLEMDVQQALDLFENVPRIRGMLRTLHDVGLDYIKLGQSSTTLSGGEAQRMKLARELVKRPTGRTLYVLDEPTTGLHFEDIRKLLLVLHSFVDAGNTVVVIEHNLDVIKTADWVIDLGPEGGQRGGRLVAEGTPEDLANCEASFTGQALREVLSQKAESRIQKNAVTSQHAERPGASEFATPASDAVRVVGARQHNLRDLTVSFPRNKMTVCSGVSGSGKTSFAIDTVFTEGYRRYVESLSAYARQFLGQLAKPRVEHVEGLSPAICIEQKAASRSPRSTVGTITEVYDYMRVLWARCGTPYCPRCAVPIGTQTADEIVDRVLALGEGRPIVILAPVAPADGENWSLLLARLKGSGYSRIRIDGQIVATGQTAALDARRRHRVEVVVDRTIVRAKARGRIAESVEHALALGDGVMMLVAEELELAHPADDAAAERPQTVIHPAHEFRFSQRFACSRCGESYEEISPHSFSFNSQLGWCETCEGLGAQRGAPAAAIIRKPERTLFNGAIDGWERIDPDRPLGRMLAGLCHRLGVSPDTPLRDWTQEQINALLFGTTGDAIPADGPAELPGNARLPRAAQRSARRGREADPADERRLRFHWRGFFPTIDAATRNSWSLRFRLQNVVTDIPCGACRGGRLRPLPGHVRLGLEPATRTGADAAPALPGRTIVELCEVPLAEAAQFFATLKLDASQSRIAGELLKETRDRLQFLLDVGLEYLTINRAAPTLSGGEAQRIRLASQIGSGLSGVLYVLDEPTIGLHPRDNQRLIRALLKLRDLGNTLLVVEHDRDVIGSADRLLDFGPRAGALGGRIVWEADGARAARAARGDEGGAESLTRAYLGGQMAIPVPTNRRPVERGETRTARSAGRAAAGTSSPGTLVIRAARQNNLQHLDVAIPLARFVVVTGVSGSGKSSLVNDILWPALANRLNNASLAVGAHDAIEMLPRHDPAGRGRALASPRRKKRALAASPRVAPLIDKVINVDQSPIGATPASNPATYTGAFDWIRELFARVPDSRIRGYNANRFSFNRAGGRCEACTGNGQRCIQMHFMPDVWVECEVCKGRRYEPETLAVRYRGRSIADVLDMRVNDALQLFENVPRVRRMLQTLADVGLDYVQLGQSAATLSGGEAQRVKLATELGKPDTGRTLYILDEPTTGLHFDDVRKLLAVLHRLVDLGNTVIVVEHNLDVIKNADWILDLGPEAGAAGGRIVVEGTPEQIVALHDARGAGAAPRWHTAAALGPVLGAGPHEAREVYDRERHAREELAASRRALGDVGSEVRPPWATDGRRWHLEQRTSRDGRERRWQRVALEFVIETVEQAGRAPSRRGQPGGSLFAPTNWNERASIEVTAPGADTWFLHALTGGEWLLELYFRAPPGTFDAAELNKKLGLKSLDERDDIGEYGNWPRAQVRTRQDGMDAVALYVYDRAEIDTPAFRAFVRDAVRAYASGLGKPALNPSGT